MHLFSQVTDLRTQEEFPASPQKVTDLDFVKPPSEGVLNNANTCDSKKGSDEAKFTASRNRTRSDVCIVAYIATDFRNESAKIAVKMHHIAKMIFCDVQIALNTWSHLKPCNRAIHIVGCKKVYFRDIAFTFEDS